MRARTEVGAAAFEFEQVGQQLGVLVYVEHETRHVPPGRLGHEGFAPEAEQGLAAAAVLAVREDEGKRAL